MATSPVPATSRGPKPGPATAEKAAGPQAPAARSGRRRGPTATREAVLAAARQAFAEQGYAATSLREVARRAGVDASLIVHFYGSKAGLLTELVQWPADPGQAVGQITADGPEQFGYRLARVFIDSWEKRGNGTSLLMLLHAAIADPKAAALLREFMKAQLIEPVLAYLDADRPALRASLITGQLFGFGIAHYLLDLDELTDTADQLAEVLGTALQRLATEPL